MSRNRPEDPRRRVRPRVEREAPAPTEQVQRDICWRPVPGLPYDVSNTRQVRSYHVRSGFTSRIADEPHHLLHPIDDPQTGQKVVTLCDGIGNEVTVAVDYLYELIFELPEGVAAAELRPQPRLTGPRAEIVRIEQELRRIFYQSRSRLQTHWIGPGYARDLRDRVRRVEAAARDIATLMESRLGTADNRSRN